MENGFILVFDALLSTLLLYRIYTAFKNNISLNVLLGMMLLALLYIVASTTQMPLLTKILQLFWQLGGLLLIVLFQQEIKHLLFTLGSATGLDVNMWLNRLTWKRQSKDHEIDVTPIVETAKLLAGSNTGGIIVLSKSEDLKFYEDSGDALDAIVSKRLLLAILNKQSPLHDGGVIIRNGKIVAARCILPVTDKKNIPAQFGLRHRAAIGITEVADVLALVISEETGQTSIATQGQLQNNLSIQELRAAIVAYLKSQ